MPFQWQLCGLFPWLLYHRSQDGQFLGQEVGQRGDALAHENFVARAANAHAFDPFRSCFFGLFLHLSGGRPRSG